MDGRSSSRRSSRAARPAAAAGLALGDIVFTGGPTGPFDVIAGAVYELRSDSNPELGTLRLTVEP